MNESSFTRDVLRVLKGNSVTLKFADRFTAGIPDLWHVAGGIETWLELKAVGEDENPIDRVSHDKAQLQTACRMTQHGARVFYVIALGKLISVWHPEYLVRRIITDLNFQWSPNLPIGADGCLEKVLENFLKKDPMDPIIFTGNYAENLNKVRILTETRV